jgi:transposase
MLLAEVPELSWMTAGEAASMPGLAPVPHAGGAMRGRRMIAKGRRALRYVLFQAALPAACRNPLLRLVARCLESKGKPHVLIIVAVVRQLISIANAALRTRS